MNYTVSAALEAMLHGEMDARLGYQKNRKRSGNNNARNGSTTKKIKNRYG